MKNKLSVCIICKNEETVIERCLQSVQWADEIVVLDSGSSDNTLDIARRYTDKVFCNQWPGFGLQRQKAASLASHEWIFAIDCDEVVPNQLKNEISQYFSQEHLLSSQVFRLNRLTEFCGRFVRHSGWYPDRIARIYNKTHTNYNDFLVHEYVSVQGCQLIDLQSDLLHFNVDSWGQYTKTLQRYAEDSAQDKYNRGQTSTHLNAYARAFFAFFRHYIFKLGFLDGKAGLLIAYAQVKYTASKYLRLIEKNIKN